MNSGLWRLRKIEKQLQQLRFLQDGLLQQLLSVMRARGPQDELRGFFSEKQASDLIYK